MVRSGPVLYRCTGYGGRRTGRAAGAGVRAGTPARATGRAGAGRTAPVPVRSGRPVPYGARRPYPTECFRAERQQGGSARATLGLRPGPGSVRPGEGSRAMRRRHRRSGPPAASRRARALGRSPRPAHEKGPRTGLGKGPRTAHEKGPGALRHRDPASPVVRPGAPSSQGRSRRTPFPRVVRLPLKISPRRGASTPKRGHSKERCCRARAVVRMRVRYSGVGVPMWVPTWFRRD